MQAGAIAFDGKAEADADLNYDANTIAWVYDDDPTLAGVYQKVGASGSGSWNRLGALPYGTLRATNSNSGDPDAITATTPQTVNEQQLILLPIVADNQNGTVTVAFNGGDPLTIKTIRNEDPAIGGLKAGAIHAGVKEGSNFRLLTGAEQPIMWRSAWADTTTYSRLDAVKHGGASYICTSGHTASSATEPGVGADWQTVWDLMAQKGDAGVGETLPSVALSIVRRNAANDGWDAFPARTAALHCSRMKRLRLRGSPWGGMIPSMISSPQTLVIPVLARKSSRL